VIRANSSGASAPATVTVYSMTRTVRVMPPPEISARYEPPGRKSPAWRRVMPSLTWISTWVPVASIRAMRGTPGKFLSMIHRRPGVNTCGQSFSALSSSTCSASPLSRLPPAAAPDGPDTTARADRVEA